MPFKGHDEKSIDTITTEAIMHPSFTRITNEWKKSMEKRRAMKLRNKENFEKFVLP